MCGIAGIFKSQDNNDAHAVNVVQNILHSQRHRGPDAEQLISVNNNGSQLVLGHNRLAIIDLSNTANQPMWDISNRYLIIFNGMIYNFREIRAELTSQYIFQTNSDTEVLINAFAKWGMESCHKLNGMFAFAIYDKLKNSLHLVRDRFGVKPLYYIIHNNSLYFASSSQQLVKELKLKINANYLYHGLHSWCYENNSNETPYADLQLLPAGYALQATITQSRLQTELKCYYNLSERVQVVRENIAGKSYSELYSLTNVTLQEAIANRLIADVPIGISLSGGVDSAIIAGFVATRTEPVMAFSYGHPDHRLSEGRRVAQLAQNLNVKVKYVNPNAQQMVDAFWQSLHYQDAPFPNFSIPAQYLVYKTAAQQGIKVLLGGQGGDEIFMGYRKFLLFQFQELLKQKSGIELLWYVFTMLPNMYAEIANARRYLYALRRYASAKNTQSNLELLRHNPSVLNLGYEKSLSDRQVVDVMHTSLPTLLRYEDRNSMANSIESRLPFLDYRLVELGIALPSTLKIKNGYGKWILRNIGSNVVPKQYIFSRIKRGFDTQTSHWIHAGVGQSIRDFFKQHSVIINLFVNKQTKVDDLYSDRNLIHNPFLLHEAIILSWLVGKTLC